MCDYDFYKWHDMNVLATFYAGHAQIFWRYDIMVFFYAQSKNQLFTSPFCPSDIPRLLNNSIAISLRCPTLIHLKCFSLWFISCTVPSK